MSKLHADETALRDGTVARRGGSEESHAKVISSAELMADRSEVRITHEGRVYRLRKTTNGKLILTR